MLNKTDSARIQGMQYAARVIKEKGLDEFTKELKYRDRSGIAIPIKAEEVNRNFHKIIDQMITLTLTASCAVLLDEFDFSHDDLQRFRDRYELKSACIGDNYASWQDFIDILAEEAGITVSLE